MVCQVCLKGIHNRYEAVRDLSLVGGWKGVYCSFECLAKERRVLEMKRSTCRYCRQELKVDDKGTRVEMWSSYPHLGKFRVYCGIEHMHEDQDRKAEMLELVAMVLGGGVYRQSE